MGDLQSFLSQLEREGQLARIRVEVDPELEITEIATRVVKEQGPAMRAGCCGPEKNAHVSETA